MGVVWGEGDGAVDQRARPAGADIAGWVEHLLRTAWRRLFMHGGEA